MVVASILLASLSLTPLETIQEVEPPETRTIELDGRSLLALARRMEAGGQQANSEAIYRSLLVDRDGMLRNEARFRLAGMIARRGEHKAAALLLRDLLAERADATNARLMLAELLLAMGDEEAARQELRALRADDRLPAEIARTIDQWANALMARRPYGVDLSVALAPDSNINRATRSDTLGTIIGDFDISEDGKARSGTGLAFRAQAFGRLGISENANLVGRVITGGNLYRDKAYRDVGIDFLVGPEVRFGHLRLNAQAGIGRRWYGGETFLDSKRVALDAALPLSGRTQLRAGAGLAWLDNRFNDLQDGTSRSASLGLDHQFSPVLGVTLNGSYDRFRAEDPGYATKQWRLGGVAWRDVGPFLVSAGGSYGQLDADARLFLFPERREDRNITLNLGVTARHWRWQEFAPSVRLTREWNRSSIEIYDFARTRVEFGVARAF